MEDYIQTQSIDKPLFPDLIWSRPENKLHAGKLLILGGNAQGFSSIGEAYNLSIKAGAGTVRVILPDVLRSTVSKFMPEATFITSTPSGSMAKSALAELISEAMWADGVLIAGDLGRNSETAILLQEFVSKFHGQVTITRDAADYFTRLPQPLLARSNTTLVISLSQLQRLFTTTHQPRAITLNIDLLKLAELVHEFSLSQKINLITRHFETTVIAANGRVSLTKKENDQKIWRLKTATSAAIWWLQNPQKDFEALSCSVIYEG